MDSVVIPERPKRNFLPQNLSIDSWSKLEPFFKNLEEKEISSFDELKAWLINQSELEAVLEEDMAWRYIKMSLDTQDEKASKDFHFFIFTF